MKTTKKISIKERITVPVPSAEIFERAEKEKKHPMDLAHIWGEKWTKTNYPEHKYKGMVFMWGTFYIWITREETDEEYELRMDKERKKIEREIKRLKKLVLKYPEVAVLKSK